MLTTQPAPLSIDSAPCYQDSALELLFQASPQPVLAYKKVTRKVQPVSALLPEDYWIIWHIPIYPLLSLPPLPTHPPDFTPGT